MGKLLSSILQAQVELLALTLLLTNSEGEEYEEQVIPSQAVSAAAKRGLALHNKFGGGRNIALAEALAEQQPLTMENINTLVEFFEKFKLDQNDPGWYNPEKPSAKWICWSLMGDESGKQLAIQTKTMIEEGLKDKSIKIKAQ
ncbi:hypothetical protein [Nostoc cycadae]|uniref:Uncharacterized protein n=1 Tax=Nostoc cycadae WK-1 TaxID=1861711 RepID=A0A2H6LL24_9NOSO|nr:hypothetical protein [Nostoc cycadae]GBE93904.1 hypothetical protein NCWK1_3669 [Nostoc cycadae WK-1]